MDHGLTFEQLLRAAIGSGLSPDSKLKAAIRVINCQKTRFFTPENHSVDSGNIESQLIKQLFEPIPDVGSNFEKGYALRMYVEGVSGGGGGGADVYVNGYNKVGNNLELTLTNGGTITIPNIFNKETLDYFGTGNPNTVAPTPNVNDRPLAAGDLYTDKATGQVYKYTGTTWALIFDPYNQYEEFTLDANGSATLSTITGFAALVGSGVHARYDLYMNGQKMYFNNGDFTVSGNTITFSPAAEGNFCSLLVKF